MRTEDLFKYGVTPNGGEHKGERFKVLSISENGIAATDWNQETGAKYNFTHGNYELWQEPKTLFEDVSIVATLGNLKKAVEKAGLGDDTRIKTVFHSFLVGVKGCQDASAKIIEVDGKKAILFY